MRLGYIRTSTDTQLAERQIDGLQPHCDEVCIELGTSAISQSRPIFDSVLKRLSPGDTLVVWDLDRAFRSTTDALTQLDMLREQGVEIKIVSLSLDTSTPAGMLIYTVLAALAQWERDTIRQRTREGIAAARRRGKRIGRPPKVPSDQLLDAKKAIEAREVTVTAAAKVLGLHPWSLTRAIKRCQAH